MTAALPVPTWEESDDPDDPCELCVQWFTPEEWMHWPPLDVFDPCPGERMSPYMPDGPVARLYREPHTKCAADLARHLRGEP